jgi:hypothetical protein
VDKIRLAVDAPGRYIKEIQGGSETIMLTPLLTPGEIYQKINYEKISIHEAVSLIDKYALNQAMKAISEYGKVNGHLVDKEIEESLERINQKLNELIDKTEVLNK